MRNVPLIRPELVLSEAEGATFSRREKALKFLIFGVPRRKRMAEVNARSARDCVVDEIVFDAAQRHEEFFIDQQLLLDLFCLGVTQSAKEVVAKHGFAHQDCVLYKEWRNQAKRFIRSRDTCSRTLP